MECVEEILRDHAHRYPLAEPCDFVKLLFQQEFGGEHMIKDPQQSLLYLRQEYNALNESKQGNGVLWESIGNGMARLSLKAVFSGKISLPLLNTLFAVSAGKNTGSLEGLKAKLDILRKESEKGTFSFSAEELESFLENYAAAGYPAVHHSQRYKEAYSPAYRVVDLAYIPLLPLLHAVEKTVEAKGRCLIALDGPAASGKSTVGERLAKVLDSSCIHMDDFFLPFSLRTQQRLSQPGGNVHYERFQEEVLAPLKEGRPFSYRVFDCASGDYSACKEAFPHPVEIIEGSYSQHPYFEEPYDITVFLQISPQEQQNRILARNGEKGWKMFRDRWIPLENAYFSAFSIAEKSEFRIETDFSRLPLFSY